MTNITDNFTKSSEDHSHFLSIENLENTQFEVPNPSINSSNLFAFRTNDLARIFSTGEVEPNNNNNNSSNNSNSIQKKQSNTPSSPIWGSQLLPNRLSRLVQLEESLEDSDISSDSEYNLPELGDIDIGISETQRNNFFWGDHHENNLPQFITQEIPQLPPHQSNFNHAMNHQMNSINHQMNVMNNPMMVGFNPFQQPVGYSPFVQYQQQQQQRQTNYQSPEPTASYMNHHRSVSVDSAFLSKVQPSTTTPPVFSDDTNIKLEEYSSSSNLPLCRYFAAGYCNRGDRCSFSHDRRDDSKKDAKEKINKIAKNKTIQKGKKVTEDLADATSKYSSIEEVVGQIYKLCKDQHGCRFLQKQLEEGKTNVVQIVFSEVYDHIVELMTDPFGNYLCQKLIEFCDDHQQLLIVQKVSSHLVTISKNMHGTRAVQKMIECLVTPNQVQLVVNALKSSVVPLIQDLNGNHVIQRCLYRLSTKDKQFVYDAVAANCVEVATHRHGCCVMQRCIDYASEEQKLQLVKEITNNVLSLVQDPFGNYVVQYVLDLPFMIVKVQLISQFLGHLSYLSTQKFSSNVIEKCIRVASESVKYDLIEELMLPHVLPQLLQDPFGNYVIQTALGCAVNQQKARLMDAIRPHLPNLRNAPYGKRIQNKITKDN